MTHNPDPIRYYEDCPWSDYDDGLDHGWLGPGWYFWNEIWIDLYGPYDTEADAREALKEYARNL